MVRQVVEKMSIEYQFLNTKVAGGGLPSIGISADTLHGVMQCSERSVLELQ